MADVFLGVVHGPAGFSKLQVIKQLRSNLTEEPEFLAMFLDEARLAARLSHRNVVQTNEVGQVDGRYFIAMEYLDGQPLNRILRQCRKTNAPPRGILLRIVADALAGLHHAHELADYDGTPLNVVHRDASPHNIFVTYEGQTKVVDFGIAKAAMRSVETASGLLKGKVSYMAPEQATSRREVDRRADVYVLGVVLWEVVANRRMWEGGTDVEIISRSLQGDLPSLKEANPDAPQALVEICARATALEPSRRYATAVEMRNAILDHLEQSGQRVETEDVGRFVSELFANRRVEFQKVIDRQLSEIAPSSSPMPIDELTFEPPSARLPSLNASMDAAAHTPSHLKIPSLSQLRADAGPPSSQRPSAPSSVSTKPSGMAHPFGTPVSVTPPSVAPPPRGKLGYQLLAVAVAAAIATAVTLRVTNKKDAPVNDSPAPTEGAHVATTSAPAAQPLPSPEPPRAAELMELRVEADPKSAKLFMDGAQLPSNPFSAKFPSDGSGHRIRAEASGYASQSRIVIFDRDIKLKLDLDQPAAPPRVGRGRPAVAVAPPPPPPSPAAPALPTATEPAAAAGKPKRSIDSGNPWANQATPTTTSAPAKPKRQLDNPWGP
jgi:eukaryotic-like serine/threonine-protein kinase